MIIDIHTHIGSNLSGYHSNYTYDSTYDELICEMNDNDITSSVVFPTPVSHRYLNSLNTIIESLSDERLIPFTMIDPTNNDVYNARCGIKLHPVAHGYTVSHKICDDVFEYAAQYSIPVIVHSGWGEHGKMRYIEERAKISRNVKIIVAHMIEPDCLDVVSRNYNLYIDTSYAPNPKRIRLAIDMCGVDRVLFGSDWPSNSIGFELSKILYAGLTSYEMNRVLYRNAKEVLGGSYTYTAPAA